MPRSDDHLTPPLSRRDRKDVGRVNAAWRWFSERTRQSAVHYRDRSWHILGTETGLCMSVLILSRLFPTYAISLFAFIICVFWMLGLLRIWLIKAFDTSATED